MLGAVETTPSILFCPTWTEFSAVHYILNQIPQAADFTQQPRRQYLPVIGTVIPAMGMAIKGYHSKIFYV
jgi:hypothetical protein